MQTDPDLNSIVSTLVLITNTLFQTQTAEHKNTARPEHKDRASKVITKSCNSQSDQARADTRFFSRL